MQAVPISFDRFNTLADADAHERIRAARARLGDKAGHSQLQITHLADCDQVNHQHHRRGITRDQGRKDQRD